MTVYGGPPPAPPRIKPDPVLFGAFGFLVVAVVAGLIFALQGALQSGGSSAVAANSAPAVEPTQPAAAPVTSAAAPPSPAPSPTPSQRPALVPAKPTTFHAGHSGLCMQVADGNGGNATQTACDLNPGQQWVPRAVAGSQDTFTVVNVKDNRCLDVNGGSKDNGAPILQWDCHGGPNQQWRLQPDGNGFRFVSVNSGRCIGVDSGNPAPGAAVRQWDCDNSTNQRWQFVS